MCNTCIHAPVCSIYRATGGMKQCEHYRGEFKPETIITFDGYNAKALAMIATMLRNHWITEDELDIFVKDFAKMHEIIFREQKTIISETMATFEWPSLGETIEMMWNERNCAADMKGENHGSSET